MENYFTNKKVYFSGDTKNFSLSMANLFLELVNGHLLTKFAKTGLDILVLLPKYGEGRVKTVKEMNASGKYHVEILTENEFLSKYFQLPQDCVDSMFDIPVIKK